MKINCGACKKLGEAIEISAYARYKCKSCLAINEVVNVDLKSWLGFNYLQFLTSIEKFIRKDNFSDLKANTELEKLAGYLSENQIKTFKNILLMSFNEGLNIKEISSKLKTELNLQDLKAIEDGKIAKNEDGSNKILVDSDTRAVMISRTETTRVAAEGALLNYSDNNVSEVSFLASFSDRTCADCESYNGKIMSISEATNMIPVHPNCRCTFIPIIKS